MHLNARRDPPHRSKQTYSISWKDADGLTHSTQVQGENTSDSGIAVRHSSEIRKGTVVYVQTQQHTIGYAVVHHVTRNGPQYTIGLELDDAAKKARPAIDIGEASDYYDFLQISPKAQAETIHRVYRFLAARYHPDNPQTGDPEKFLLLNRAYDVLSDASLRARYDKDREAKVARPSAVFDSVDFLDGVEGEVNRRLAVLSVLYRKCRSNVHSPCISLLHLEAYMGFPREYLDFTLWYLRSKKYVKQEDNAELSLTSSGVDHVEDNYAKLPLLRKLLTAGTPFAGSSGERPDRTAPELTAEVYILSAGDSKA